MRRSWVFLLILGIGLRAGPALADVYSWVDGDGVRHFSNIAPPDTTPGVTSVQEQAYDPVADQQRTAIDRGTLDKIYKKQMSPPPPPESKASGPAVSPAGSLEKSKADAASEEDSAGSEDAAVRRKTFAQKQRARAAAARNGSSP